MKGCRPLTRIEVMHLVNAMAGVNQVRNRAMVLIGFNTGYRISEILSLRRMDLVDEFGGMFDQVKVARKYMKGNKSSRSVELNSGAKKAFKTLLVHLEAQGFLFGEDFLFQSHKGGPLSYSGAWRCFRLAAFKAKIPGGVGTHSMRKTFANNAYMNMRKKRAAGSPIDPLRSVSELLGHKDINTTIKYLSFCQDDIKETLEEISI